MSGEAQEALDGLADVQDGSGVPGSVVPLSESGTQITNKFVDQRRRKVGGVDIFVQEPLLEIPDVAGGLAKAVDIEVPIQEAPQERFPGGGQVWESLCQGSRRPFEDFAERLWRVRGISAKEIPFVHASDLNEETGGGELTRLLRGGRR